jgi:hypothetical protein
MHIMLLGPGAWTPLHGVWVTLTQHAGDMQKTCCWVRVHGHTLHGVWVTLTHTCTTRGGGKCQLLGQGVCQTCAHRHHPSLKPFEYCWF